MNRSFHADDWPTWHDEVDERAGAGLASRFLDDLYDQYCNEMTTEEAVRWLNKKARAEP